MSIKNEVEFHDTSPHLDGFRFGDGLLKLGLIKAHEFFEGFLIGLHAYSVPPNGKLRKAWDGAKLARLRGRYEPDIEPFGHRKRDSERIENVLLGKHRPRETAYFGRRTVRSFRAFARKLRQQVDHDVLALNRKAIHPASHSHRNYILATYQAVHKARERANQAHFGGPQRITLRTITPQTSENQKVRWKECSHNPADKDTKGRNCGLSLFCRYPLKVDRVRLYGVFGFNANLAPLAY